MMERKAYTAFGEMGFGDMGFGEMGFGETGRHRYRSTNQANSAFHPFRVDR